MWVRKSNANKAKEKTEHDLQGRFPTPASSAYGIGSGSRLWAWREAAARFFMASFSVSELPLKWLWQKEPDSRVCSAWFCSVKPGLLLRRTSRLLRLPQIWRNQPLAALQHLAGTPPLQKDFSLRAAEHSNETPALHNWQGPKSLLEAPYPVWESFQVKLMRLRHTQDFSPQRSLRFRGAINRKRSAYAICFCTSAPRQRNNFSPLTPVFVSSQQY